MNVRATIYTAAAAVAVTALISLSSPAYGDRSDLARQKFKEGVAALKAEDFPKALMAFEASYKIKPKSVVLYNIGMCQKALFMYTQAIETFEKLLSQHKATLSDKHLKETTRTLAEAKKLVAKLEVNIQTQGAKILLDGREVSKTPLSDPLILNPGKHVIEIRKTGHVPHVQELDVESGYSVTLNLPALNPEKAQKTADIAPEKGQAFSDDPSTTSTSDSDAKKSANAAKGGSQPEADPPVKNKGRKSQKLFFSTGVAALTLGVGSLALGGVFTWRWYRDYDYLEIINEECAELWRSSCVTEHNEWNDELALDETLLITGYSVGGTLTAAGVVLMLMYRKKKKQQIALSPIPGGLQFRF